MSLVFRKPRRTFGDAYQFHDVDAQDHLTECRAYVDLTFDVPIVRINEAVDAAPHCRDEAAFTPWAAQINVGEQYEPHLYSSERLLEIEGSPEFAAFLSSASGLALTAVEENAVFDPVASPLPPADDDAEAGGAKQTTLREFQAYAHLQLTQGKVVTSLAATTVDKTSYVLVSLLHKDSFEERSSNTSGTNGGGGVSAILWNLLDQMRPALALSAPAELTCAQFNPGKSGVIAAGTVDGSVVVYELGNLNEVANGVGDGGGAGVWPTRCSPSNYSHIMPVGSVVWLGSFNHIDESGDISIAPGGIGCSQFASASPDGSISIWDIVKDMSNDQKAAASLGLLQTEDTDSAATDCRFLYRVTKIDLSSPMTLNPVFPLCVEFVDARGLSSGTSGMVEDARDKSPVFVVGDEAGSVGVGRLDESIAAHNNNLASVRQKTPHFPPFMPLPSFVAPTLRSVRWTHRGAVHTLELSICMPELVLSADSSCFCLWLDSRGLHDESYEEARKGLEEETELLRHNTEVSREVGMCDFGGLRDERLRDAEPRGAEGGGDEREADAPDALGPFTGLVGSATDSDRRAPPPPVFRSPDNRAPASAITACCLSGAKPGVIFVGTGAGTVEIWDVLDRTTEPVITSQICTDCITTLQYMRKASLLNARRIVSHRDILLVGTDAGKLHVVEVPKTYRTRVHREKDILRYTLGRSLEGAHYVHGRRVGRDMEWEMEAKE